MSRYLYDHAPMLAAVAGILVAAHALAFIGQCAHAAWKARHLPPLIGPPMFVDQAHREDHDALEERRFEARMWLRRKGFEPPGVERRPPDPDAPRWSL